MRTVVGAAAIAGAARLAIKWTSRVGVVVIVGEYSIIELCIRMAIATHLHVAGQGPCLNYSMHATSLLSNI